MHFDYRDILRGPRFALSFPKIWLQLLGFLKGYSLYVLFTYVAFLAAGFPLKYVWLRYGLLPCFWATGDSFPWYAWVIHISGVILLIAFLVVSQTAVARSVFVQAKGDNFYTWREAGNFASNKKWSLLLAPASLLLLIVFMLGAGVLFSLFGKIPVVGELGVSLLTIIWVLGALLGIYLLIVAAVSLVMVPAIIASSDEDAFEAIFQAFSISWKQPWRFAFYQSLNIAFSLFAMAVMAFFLKESVYVLNWLFGAFMGPDFINLANNGQAYVQGVFLPGQMLLENISPRLSSIIYFSHEFIVIPAAELPLSVVIGSWLYASSLLFIAGWVVSYGLASFASGNTLLYLALRQKKDGTNLLEIEEPADESSPEPSEPAQSN